MKQVKLIDIQLGDVVRNGLAGTWFKVLSKETRKTTIDRDTIDCFPYHREQIEIVIKGRPIKGRDERMHHIRGADNYPVQRLT